MRPLLQLVMAGVVLGGAGWLGHGAAQAFASTTASATIDNFTFTPAILTVTAGTVVTWTNQDDIPHTIVMPDPAHPVKSPALDTDDHFTITFARPGTYRYFCSLHPHMQGTVVVP